MLFATIDELQQALARQSYIAERPLATAIFLALKLQKPLLLEGEAGVGKTEIAKTLSRLLDRHLIRLQCYEGLDVNTTIYEWNYTRQMLQIRLLESQGAGAEHRSLDEIFGPEFLIKRPLLQAIEESWDRPPVLLIDELDRADEEFEAFLLELLSDWQITIPELGTMRAATPPTVIITSTRTREVHDALKRRCLFHWVDYPSLEKERQIVQAKVPGASEALSRQVVAFVQELRIITAKVPGVSEKLAKQVAYFIHELRREDLYKLPGVAETLDWAAALLALNQQELTTEIASATLGAILKHQEDVHAVRRNKLEGLVGAAVSSAE